MMIYEGMEQIYRSVAAGRIFARAGDETPMDTGGVCAGADCGCGGMREDPGQDPEAAGSEIYGAFCGAASGRAETDDGGEKNGKFPADLYR